MRVLTVVKRKAFGSDKHFYRVCENAFGETAVGSNGWFSWDEIYETPQGAISGIKKEVKSGSYVFVALK